MFKPCTTKTSIVNRSFDEMGNLLWQQEAAEFIEQYPQRRKPKTAALLLRQSASAGTLYRKTEMVMPILNKRASGGELLTTQQRHQRDLFSGDLGIPDVNSHVGSMVHTFENMALQRQLAEKQRKQREREHSKYLAELMAMQAAAEPEQISPTTNAAFVATTTTTKRTFIPSSGTHTTSSKLQQIKKKTHETRQKIIQQILQSHPLHKDIVQATDTPRHLEGARQAFANTEVYYRNIGEDYRKNLFGTLTKRQANCDYKRSNSDVETSSFCDEIVAQAFDEIFEGYSGLEDEEDLPEVKQLGKPVADFTRKSYGRPGCTPKKLPKLSKNKKNPAPKPPSSCCSTATHAKRKVMPFLEPTQRSSTIQNIFERLRTPSKTSTNNTSHKLNKTSSDTSLKTGKIFPGHSKPFLSKIPAHLQIKREIEGQESSENLEQDFLRGSTVSQSFVKHKHTKGKAPPTPQTLETPTNQRHLKTSEALRHVLLFSKKSLSAGELVPNNYASTVETRKYYRRLDDGDNIAMPQSSVLERRNPDGCGSLGQAVNGYSPQQAVEI